MTLGQLSETERRVLYLLQDDLPDALRPFDEPARQAGLSVEEFLAAARRHLEEGRLRKIVALLNHRQAGFTANAMCVWRVPAGRADAAGEIMARFEEVTHCYRRPVSDGWPYALFTMIHGRTRAECEAVIRRIADAVRPDEYRILYSTRELKKCSLRLPLPAE